LSCDDSLLGSRVSLTGYLDDQQVVKGTDAHGLSGFGAGTLQFAGTTARAEVRFSRADAVVPDASKATARRSPPGVSSPAITGPPPTTPTSPSITTQAPPPSLAGPLVPAPAGFALSTRAAIHNGPVDAAGFNKFNQSATAAADLHFVAGYDVTYDSLTGSDSIEVTQLDFGSSSDADAFQEGFSFSDQPTGSADDPVIPGGYDYNSPKANPDGGFEHGVIAIKGSRAMVIDYLNSNIGPMPLVAAIAKQQYADM
jgi:hypothetical protein